MSQLPEQRNDDLGEQNDINPIENSPQQNNSTFTADGNRNLQPSGNSNISTYGTSNHSPQINDFGRDVEAQTINSDRTVYSDDSSGLLSLKLPQVGYRRLATKMGTWDSEISLFRRFGDLNMLNLLSLQAELMHLRLELDRTCRSDDKINELFNASRKYAFSFKAMQDSVPEDDTDQESTSPSVSEDATSRNIHCCACMKKKDLPPVQVRRADDGKVVDNQRTDQWETILKLREKLKEYNETLLQVSQIQQLDSVGRKEFSGLRSYLDRVEDSVRNIGDKNHQEPAHFDGVERRAWSDAFDMVSLNPSSRPKFLARNLHKMFFKLPSCFSAGNGKMGTPNESFGTISDPTTERARDKRLLSYFKHKKAVQYMTGLIQSAIAAAIPGLSVLVLYKVHNIQDRINVLIALTVAFAIVVKLIRVTREVDIFSVTAAFVAVLVVFVGSPATTY